MCCPRWPIMIEDHLLLSLEEVTWSVAIMWHCIQPECMNLLHSHILRYYQNVKDCKMWFCSLLEDGCTLDEDINNLRKYLYWINVLVSVTRATFGWIPAATSSMIDMGLSSRQVCCQLNLTRENYFNRSLLWQTKMIYCTSGNFGCYYILQNIFLLVIKFHWFLSFACIF